MWRFLAGLAVFAAVFFGTAFVLRDVYAKGDAAGWNRRDAVAWQSAAKASEAARRTEALARDAASALDARHEAAAEKIRVVYRTLEKEVPVHAPSALDPRYPLSVGWVRLHDAAALGVSAGAVAGPAGLADDEPDPVGASAAAGVIVANYERCRTQAQQLSDLQTLIRGQPGYP